MYPAPWPVCLGVELTFLNLAIESLPPTLCGHVTVSLELSRVNGTRIILILF